MYLRLGEHFPLSTATRGGGVPAGTREPQSACGITRLDPVCLRLSTSLPGPPVRILFPHTGASMVGVGVCGDSGVCLQIDGQDCIVMSHMMLDLLLSIIECFLRSRMRQALS